MQSQQHICSISSSGGIGSSSSSSIGLHAGVRVLSQPSTSSVPWRYPAPAPTSKHLHLASHHQHHNQQQCPAASSSSPEDSQAFRFKHKFNPERVSHLPEGSWFGWPLKDGEKMAAAGEQARLDPEQTFWRQQAPVPSSVRLTNPWAQHFRVARVPMPVPVSLPGSDYWHVEMLNNYATNWPSVKWVDGKLQFRKGFLEPFDDPKVVPFFFYRGLEQITYSWSDRAFQALFTAVYAGVHLALFSWFWQGSPSLALAVALNWGLGKLSIAKWGILLFLAFSDRMWLYFLYLGGKLIDRALAKLFPPVREFFWAMFTMWLLFVAVTPAYYCPLPFAPFAPGTMGPQEAIA